MRQGMNISMQDAYNLGWKLGLVLEGSMRASILSTYESERRPVAEELMRLDKKTAEVYSRGPSQDSREYQDFRNQFQRFISGVNVTYGPNQLVPSETCTTFEGEQSPQVNQIAQNLRVGQRIASHRITCQASGDMVGISDLLSSTTVAWRILVFSGDINSRKTFERL